MSSNLIGGFHARLEGSRKFLFGSAGVYGTNNDSAIQGVYIVRGSSASFLQAFEYRLNKL
jgi:elongation factor 1-gamma